MYIELKKVEFVNKGAELMLHAMIDKLSKRYPNARFVMEPEEVYRPYEKRAELKLFQKAAFYKYRIQWGNLARYLPKFILRQYGIVTEKQLNVVLDSSGFSYSDQWGPGGTIKLSKEAIRYKRNGTKLILMPQAFGPFSSPSIKNAIKNIVDNASLIFTREQLSYEYLTNIVGKRPNIKISPDFTILMNGIDSEQSEYVKKCICIIPNYRMLDKTSQKTSEVYLPFLKLCVSNLIELGKRVVILIHESENDLILAKQISDSFKERIPILQESDPLKLKGIIGACEGTIGSRFHGLISALSQGIPSLAIGWSHKYSMLFDEFGFPEGIIDLNSDESELKHKLRLITEDTSNEEIKNRLLKRTSILKDKVERMWEFVYQEIEK